MSPRKQQKQKPKTTKTTRKSTGTETKRSTRSATKATKLTSETVSTEKKAEPKSLPKTRSRAVKKLIETEKTPKLKKETAACCSKVTKLKKTALTEILDLPLTASKKAALMKCVKPNACTRAKSSEATRKKTIENKDKDKKKPKNITEKPKSDKLKTVTKKTSTAQIKKTTKKADSGKIKQASKLTICKTGLCPFSKATAKTDLKAKTPTIVKRKLEMKRKLNNVNYDSIKKVKVSGKKMMASTSTAKPLSKLADYSSEDDDDDEEEDDELFGYISSSFSSDGDDDDDNDGNPCQGACSAGRCFPRSTYNSKTSNSQKSSQTTKTSSKNGSKKKTSENEINETQIYENFNNESFEDTKQNDIFETDENIKIQNDVLKNDAMNESETDSKEDQNNAIDTDDFDDNESIILDDIDEYIQRDNTENYGQGSDNENFIERSSLKNLSIDGVHISGNFDVNPTQNDDSQLDASNEFDDIANILWNQFAGGTDKSTVNEIGNDQNVLNQNEQKNQNGNEQNEDDGNNQENLENSFVDQNISNNEMEVNVVDDEINSLSIVDDETKSLKVEIDENKSRFYNSNTSCFVIVLLKDEIFIEGAVLVGLIAGSIDIFGYKPKLLEVTEIISPMGHNSVFIKPMNNFRDENDNEDKIIKELFSYDCVNFDFDLIKSDLECFYNCKTDAIIILKKDTGKQIQLLKKIMKENIFIDVEKISKRNELNYSELMLQCIINNKDDTDSVKTNTNWQNIKIEQNTKLMIIGGKGVGKSTLLRYVINSNLQKFKKFLLIDLDVGQPETFLPQTISATVINKPLLGPGYYYNLKSDKTFVFNDINIIMSPMYYLKLVKNLLLYCKQNNRYDNIPWFINTMGYSKGIGNEIISTICEYLKPTDIIQIQCNKDNNNYGFIMDSETVINMPKIIIEDEDIKDLVENNNNDGIQCENSISLYKHNLILLESVVDFNDTESNINKNSSSRDKRYERLLLHCNSILNDENEWFCDIVPYEAPFDKMTLISLESNDILAKDILKVINANIVYLCEKDPHTCVECYGIGIIRSVDFENNKIYLLTSLKEEILKRVTTLVVSKAQMPTSILVNQGPKIEDIAPFIYSTNDNIVTRQIKPVYNKPLKKN